MPRKLSYSLLLLGLVALWVVACKKTEGVVSNPTVTGLTCSGATFSATATSGTAYTGTVTVPYTGGNGIVYAAGSALSSTGVTGLTATLQSGTLASGSGNLTYAITGTPSGAGTAAFPLSFGGQTCTLNLTVTSVITSPGISALTCSGAAFSTTATSGTAYTGTATVPYTGGNGIAYPAGTAISSAGVTGLTATLQAGTLTATNGNLTYAILGTPSGAGTAAFALNFGGQTCTLSLPVSATGGTGLVTDNNPTLPACTTTGTVAASTNATVVALRNAMVTFRNTLTTAQLTNLAKCLDNTSTFAFTRWHNTPAKGTARGAARYGELSAAQLTAFKAVLQAFMSAAGYQKVNEITTLAEGYLNTINSGMWDPAYYWMDLYGNAATSGSWGFQLDGHHLALNFLVHGDNVTIAPAFIACEPCTGTFNGTAFDIVKDERDLGLTLYNGMSDTEKTTAVTTASSGAMSVGPPANANSVDPYAGTFSYASFATGLKYSAMTAATKTNLVAVMKEYVYNLRSEFADQWWALIEANIDNTYFVWRDQVDTPTTTTQFYYRIYNPYLWIEYAMENPVGAGIAAYNHVHTITRIPYNTTNGGDYGIFAGILNNGPRTLQEHYTTAEHHQKNRDWEAFFAAAKNDDNDRFARFKKKQQQDSEPLVEAQTESR